MPRKRGRRERDKSASDADANAAHLTDSWFWCRRYFKDSSDIVEEGINAPTSYRVELLGRSAILFHFSTKPCIVGLQKR